MKFNVSGKAMQQQLNAVSKVINSKNALSILDNFLLCISGNTLTITGSDQDNVMSATLEIQEPEGEGAIAVPAKRLNDIIKEVSSQALTFYVNDETHEIDIRFLNGHFNFMGVSPDEYPRKSDHDSDAASFAIPAKMIADGIEKTLFAVSQESIRPIMTGIFWDIHSSDITFVSSDTHKLVRYISRMAEPGIETSFIMPQKPASILRSLLPKGDETVNVTVDSKSATFTCGGYSLSCRFIKGNYPNYNRVIPDENPFHLQADRLSLLTAMRRVSLFASAASSLVRLNIQPSEILLSAQDLDYSTSAEERVACEYRGNVMTIGFNATYLIEVLGNITSDDVTVDLSDPSRPGIFVPSTQSENTDLLILLMPMQVLE